LPKIEIKFDERFKAPLKKGTKVATIRTERKGEVGDTFDAFGKAYKFTNVFECHLKMIEAFLYPRCGFKTSDDFVKFWTELYGKYSPDEKAFMHYFEEVK